MNNANLALLSKVHYDLHGPVHEVVETLDRKRINVRVKVDAEDASEDKKKRATSVRLEIVGGPKLAQGDDSIEGQTKQVIEEVVARYNAVRKLHSIDADGLIISLGGKKPTKRKKA